MTPPCAIDHGPPPDPATRAFAADALRKRLADLVRELPGARRGRDPECVHRARVACRRLRVVLDLFPDCFPRRRHDAWRRRIRDLGRGLGRARDADVQIQFLTALLASLDDHRRRRGIRRLLLRRRQVRHRLQDEVRDALDAFTRHRVAEDLDQARQRLSGHMHHTETTSSAPELRRRASDTLGNLTRDLLIFDPDADHPERSEALHAMRIAAKRLRYALELFRPLTAPEALADAIAALKSLQDHLGILHDADVWLELLPEFLEKERRRCVKFFGHARAFPAIRTGAVFVEAAVLERRAAAHAAFLETWRPISHAAYWDRLVQLLTPPAAESPHPVPVLP
jgi:CHAD domain-containing protein